MIRVPILDDPFEVADFVQFAREWRSQLAVAEFEPFDAQVAADACGYKIAPLSNSDLPESVKNALGCQHPEDFRATVTHPKGSERILYVNDSHLAECQRFCSAHELSHLFLDHEPDVFAVRGSSFTRILYEPESRQELEANTLAHLVTVPVVGTQTDCWHLSDADLATRFGVFEARVVQAREMHEMLSRAGIHEQDASSLSGAK